MNKLKIALIDLTDCEGCQVEFISMKDKFLEFAQSVEILNWRLIKTKNIKADYDISIIEGSPITEKEIEILKEIRNHSKILIGLGSCATLGGIPSIMPKKDREFWYKKIYGGKYKPLGIDAAPINSIVAVDYLIHGCPASGKEIVRVLKDLVAGKKPKNPDYSVCFECKEKQNACRLINKKACLGPITQGGCGAICVSGGEMCFGCFGYRKQNNKKAVIKILKNNGLSTQAIENYFSMFLSRQKDN